jgi:hypothetical protein
MIIAHTIKGRGVSWMELDSRWHTHAPLPDQADDALREIARRCGRPEEGYSRLGGDEVQKPRTDTCIKDMPA